MYEKKIAELMSHLEDERERARSVEEQLYLMKNLLSDHQTSKEVCKFILFFVNNNFVSCYVFV